MDRIQIGSSLHDAEVTDFQSYKVMPLEDIRHEQTEDSYRRLCNIQDRCHSSGLGLWVIEWRDGTQGVLCSDPCHRLTDGDLLRVYRNARSKRELFHAEGARS